MAKAATSVIGLWQVYTNTSPIIRAFTKILNFIKKQYCLSVTSRKCSVPHKIFEEISGQWVASAVSMGSQCCMCSSEVTEAISLSTLNFSIKAQLQIL
jgi:hypothetical protein